MKIRVAAGRAAAVLSAAALWGPGPAVAAEDSGPALFTEDLIILSSEVGVEKPDPGIFELAVERADLPPGASTFCAETPAHVLAAQAVGMRAVWLQEGDIAPRIRDLVGEGLVGPEKGSIVP